MVDLTSLGINAPTIHRNLSIQELIKKALDRNEGELSNNGSLVIKTGKYTGRSPNDKFIVDTPNIHDEINWGKTNAPIDEKYFDLLYQHITEHLSKQHELFVFDGAAGADPNYAKYVRVINERASQNLFINHLLRKESSDTPDFTILCAPGCKADPSIHGTNSEAFVILHIEKGIVLIGGTEYSGEIKKSVFSLMNYTLPKQDIMAMHASVNTSKRNDPAVFFGLSGTGKTTLSMDPNRTIIGDDEHGWSETSVFNIEGGVYPKCINLDKDKEPLIYEGIRDGALVENVIMNKGEFDFNDTSLTQNTRVAFPMQNIKTADESGKCGHPKTIIFLTADAFGVLPPVAKLSADAAVYHFMSGYTSKVAGTERGITEPKAAFSFAFGEPFMPLKHHFYGDVLKKKIQEHTPSIFLINTGWTGGAYGTGKRISLAHTREIVSNALCGALDTVEYRHDETFNLEVPKTCGLIPKEILDPKETWEDKDAYDQKSKELAQMFKDNFKRFSDISSEIINAGPQ